MHIDLTQPAALRAALANPLDEDHEDYVEWAKSNFQDEADLEWINWRLERFTL